MSMGRFGKGPASCPVRTRVPISLMGRWRRIVQWQTSPVTAPSSCVLTRAFTRSVAGWHFNQSNVTSLDWSSYQTLRFAEHPAVTPSVVQQLHEKSSGAGEEVLPAAVAAIGNAFFDATGVRLRQFPLTASRVLAALKSG
jgi:hypothetical protein